MYDYFKRITDIQEIVNNNSDFSLSENNIEKVLKELSETDLSTEYSGNVELWADFLLLGFRLGQNDTIKELLAKFAKNKDKIIKEGMQELKTKLKSEFPDATNIEYRD